MKIKQIKLDMRKKECKSTWFNVKKNEHFPALNTTKCLKRWQKKALAIEIFCWCKQPDLPTMAMYIKFEKWLHATCESILKLVIRIKDSSFSVQIANKYPVIVAAFRIKLVVKIFFFLRLEKFQTFKIYLLYLLW